MQLCVVIIKYRKVSSCSCILNLVDSLTLFFATKKKKKNKLLMSLEWSIQAHEFYASSKRYLNNVWVIRG